MKKTEKCRKIPKDELTLKSEVTLNHEFLYSLFRIQSKRVGIFKKSHLARLIKIYVKASQQFHAATTSLLKINTNKVPYIIGIAGSVAVGKSTTARLQF